MTAEAVRETLPAEVGACHAVIRDLAARVAVLEEAIRTAQRTEAQLQARLQQVLRRLYGPRTERVDANQLVLFGEAVATEPEEVASEADVAEPEAPAPKKGHGRKRPPKELPRVRVEHEVPAEQLACAHGVALRRIGEEVTEQIEYTPASLFVIEHVQPKYAPDCAKCPNRETCPDCDIAQPAVVTAPKPAQPIAKGLAGPGLLAHVVVSKYCDHLPLYRQEAILGRHGFEVSRKTLCGWVLQSAELVAPVVERMTAHALQSRVLHTDDTPIRVQGDDGPYTGRFWVYVGDEDHPYIVYDYTPSRNRDGPATFLEGFTGTPEHPRYLQADAFGGYDGIYAGNGVTEVACMAHCRRKFYDAQGTDAERALRWLAFVRQLYDVERDARDLTPDQRQALRDERARPLLTAMRAWLDEQSGHVLPKSPIGGAVQYALHQWDALTRYLDDPALDLDNNEAERALRGIAIGRKNYLFLGSDRGGRAAAEFYSLIQSAKRHRLDPFRYLRDLFYRIAPMRRLPGFPPNDLDQLLPDHWSPVLS